MKEPTVLLSFRQTAPLGCDPQLLRRVLQQYVDSELGRFWPFSAAVAVGPSVPGEWPIWFCDDADQAVGLGLATAAPDENGVLGYHADPALGPCGFVFVKTATADGVPTSVVASHELAELLADPCANQAVYTPRGRFVAYEICDPVEDTTYSLLGLPVANFLTPAWFGWPGTDYDNLGAVSRPFELHSAGYALVTGAAGGWTQIFGARNALSRAAQATGYAMKDRRLRRVNRRRRRGAPAGSGAAVAPEGFVLA